MMNRRQPGFTLVELLVVIVVGGLIMGSVVQTLVMQEKTYRATGEMVRGQDALRIAIGVLESELREIATQGPTIGTNDIVYASRDSVTFLARRNLGFVCEVHNSDRRIITWSPSPTARFTGADEGVVVFRDGVVTTGTDDTWFAARANNVNTSTAACTVKPGAQVAHNRIDLQTLAGGNLDASLLDGVWPGAPVRSFRRATYGLYSINGEWVLARRYGNGPLEPLVGGLAGQNVGLRFTYLDVDGNTITSEPAPADQVATIRISARTNPPVGTGATPVTQTTTIFLRNN